MNQWDIVITFDDTAARWEFQAHTERAKSWLKRSGERNIYSAKTYDFINLHDRESVDAMRQAAERVGLTVVELAD